MDAVLDLDVERPVAGGRMLARHDGQVVFVAGAIPGERVRVRVERVQRQASWATVVEVLEPSPDRRDVPLRSGLRRVWRTRTFATSDNGS